MIESEAKGFIQGKINCMNKCGVFNKEDNISDNDCDNCEYCYCHKCIIIATNARIIFFSGIRGFY